MSLKKIHPLFIVLAAASIGLAVHKGLFGLFVPKVYEEGFVYSIPLLYAFFTFFALLIVFILMKIKDAEINNVGYAFLGLTTVKMVVAYLFLKPILSVNLPKTPTEKINFFLIFIFFLAIETVVTIRILNNKQ